MFLLYYRYLSLRFQKCPLIFESLAKHCNDDDDGGGGGDGGDDDDDGGDGADDADDDNDENWCDQSSVMFD